jgi:hypothetical protein
VGSHDINQSRRVFTPDPGPKVPDDRAEDSPALKWLAPICSMIGVAVIWWSTPLGPAVSFDSFAYLHVAQNVLNGHGLSLWTRDGYRAMTHWPPLYPLILALLGRLGLDLLTAARILQAALFAANLGLAAAIVKRANGSTGAALAGCLALLASADMLTIHTAAWSEPLFLLLAVGGLWALADSPGQPQLIVLASALVSLATLTRYSGISLIITGALLLLWSCRIRDAAIFVLLSSLPIALWLWRNLHAAGATADRHLAWHPLWLGQVRFAGSTAAFWIAPKGAPAIARGLILAAFAALMLAVGKIASASSTAAPPLRGPIQRILLLFILTYLAFVAVSRTFIDAAIPMDARILSPVLFTGVSLLAISATPWLKLAIARPRWLCAVVILMFFVPHAIYSTRFLSDLRQNGDGYAGRDWRDSRLIAKIRTLDPATPIYTNGMIGVAFQTGRWERGLPEPIDRLTARPDPAYEANVQAMEADLHRGALLVYFRSLGAEGRNDDVQRLIDRLRLQPIFRAPDGEIYRARQVQ